MAHTVGFIASRAWSLNSSVASGLTSTVLISPRAKRWSQLMMYSAVRSAVC
ncbi:Uncharacterised protein [Mycobacteroides abscessus subsp. abscessus]|nr:Uncharacterised protein [Mycobacteroides abscessus subsp. abscessus]